MNPPSMRLPPLKAAIFDAIKASGEVGVRSREIINSEIYRDRKKPGITGIRSHINQINDLLEETEWRIRSEGFRWFLVRGRGEAAE